MIRLTLLITILFVTSSFAMKIEAVSDNKEVEKEKNFFMKGDRKVIKAMTPNILKAMTPNILKAMKNEVVLAYEVEGKLIAPKTDTKTKQIAKVENKPQKEDIKKQFAKKEELKTHSQTKEKLKVSNESADFFESLNKKDSKPVNME